MPRLPIDTVLLVIDVQGAIDDSRWGPRNNPDAEARIAELLAAWRGKALPLIHIRHDSVEPGSAYRPDRPGNAFKPATAPLPGEPVLAKHTRSAFIGTDLDARLTGAGRTTLVICGCLTHNSVEATIRHAADLGYRVVLPADACWSVDIRHRGETWPAETVHRLSLAALDREYAMVSDTAAVIAATALMRRWKWA